MMPFKKMLVGALPYQQLASCPAAYVTRGRAAARCAAVPARHMSASSSERPSEWPWRAPKEDIGNNGLTKNDAGIEVYVGKNYEQFKSNWAGNVLYVVRHLCIL